MMLNPQLHRHRGVTPLERIEIPLERSFKTMGQLCSYVNAHLTRALQVWPERRERMRREILLVEAVPAVRVVYGVRYYSDYAGGEDEE